MTGKEISEPSISIISLIYKSPKYADFVYNGIMEKTPEIKEGKAEFYFLVNNGTDEIKRHLKEKGYPHYIFDTPPQKPYPANIGDIYRAWNFAVIKAKGNIVVLVNSDMAFSKDWLENLIKNLDENKVITSRLVESGKIPSIFPHTIVKNFGRSPEEFNKEDFEIFAETIKEDKLALRGTFMPMAIHKSNFIKSGGYPNGNPGGVSGDYYFFYKVLEPMGIKHYTAMDSVAYHIQEGEVSE